MSASQEPQGDLRSVIEARKQPGRPQRALPFENVRTDRGPQQRAMSRPIQQGGRTVRTGSLTVGQPVEWKITRRPKRGPLRSREAKDRFQQMVSASTTTGRTLNPAVHGQAGAGSGGVFDRLAQVPADGTSGSAVDRRAHGQASGGSGDVFERLGPNPASDSNAAASAGPPEQGSAHKQSSESREAKPSASIPTVPTDVLKQNESKPPKPDNRGEDHKHGSVEKESDSQPAETTDGKDPKEKNVPGDRAVADGVQTSDRPEKRRENASEKKQRKRPDRKKRKRSESRKRRRKSPEESDGSSSNHAARRDRRKRRDSPFDRNEKDAKHRDDVEDRGSSRSKRDRPSERSADRSRHGSRDQRHERTSDDRSHRHSYDDYDHSRRSRRDRYSDRQVRERWHDRGDRGDYRRSPNPSRGWDRDLSPHGPREDGRMRNGGLSPRRPRDRGPRRKTSARDFDEDRTTRSRRDERTPRGVDLERRSPNSRYAAPPRDRRLAEGSDDMEDVEVYERSSGEERAAEEARRLEEQKARAEKEARRLEIEKKQRKAREEEEARRVGIEEQKRKARAEEEARRLKLEKEKAAKAAEEARRVEYQARLDRGFAQLKGRLERLKHLIEEGASVAEQEEVAITEVDFAVEKDWFRGTQEVDKAVWQGHIIVGDREAERIPAVGFPAPRANGTAQGNGPRSSPAGQTTSPAASSSQCSAHVPDSLRIAVRCRFEVAARKYEERTEKNCGALYIKPRADDSSQLPSFLRFKELVRSLREKQRCGVAEFVNGVEGSTRCMYFFPPGDSSMTLLSISREHMPYREETTLLAFNLAKDSTIEPPNAPRPGMML